MPFQMQKVEKGERQGSVAAVAELALSACCRRKGLLQHFGERRGQCHAAAEQLCDFCRDPRSVVGFLSYCTPTDSSVTWLLPARCVMTHDLTPNASCTGCSLGKTGRRQPAPGG